MRFRRKDVMPSSISHIGVDTGPGAYVKTKKSSPPRVEKTDRRDMLYE